jgi:acetoin utilization protein AcuB
MTRQPWTIAHDASLSQATTVMRDRQVRHLPVLEDGKLVGVISERDIFRLERLRFLHKHFTVEDAMTRDVYTATLDEPVDTVVETMAASKLGSVVVIDRGFGIQGVFTTVDGMQVLADVLRNVA